MESDDARLVTGGHDVARGHVKVARKAFESDAFWLESREFSRWEAWMDVIQLAAFRSHQYRTKYGVITLGRGEFVASLRGLAARFKWNLKRVRVWLATCEKGARIRAQRQTAAGTVYLIINYDVYQTTGLISRGAKGTPNGTRGAQQGHKTEAVKAVEAITHGQSETDSDSDFERAWQLYPRRRGSNPKAAAFSAWHARRAEGVTAETLIAGVERYAQHLAVDEKIGSPFVMQAKRFFGPSREYAEPWDATNDPIEEAAEAARARQDEDERFIERRLGARVLV